MCIRLSLKICLIESLKRSPPLHSVVLLTLRYVLLCMHNTIIPGSSFAINDMPSVYTSIITTRATSILSQLQSSSVPGSTTSQLQSQLQSTSVPGGREIDCTCSECSRSAVITVSAVSLLLIVTLTTVVLTQCLLMVRMKKSTDVLHRNDIYEDVLTPTTMLPDNAYMLHKMTTSSEEATYEFVK